MTIIEIPYEAKCKHPFHKDSKKNNKGRYQSFCEIKKEFITLRDKACKDFKL